jgi:hypothetical protein
MTATDWGYGIGYAAAWLESYGYEVIEASDEQDRVEFEGDVVYINSRCHPETRFYTLLHELGHVDIYENGAAEFAADHPMYYRADGGRTTRSKAGRVSILAEEIEAWKRGRWFAREAGLDLDENKYDRHMTEALMSYINWAAD